MTTKSEVDMLQVQHHQDQTLSMECDNDKMLLNKRDDLSEETKDTSDSDSNSSIDSTEVSEIIQLQDDDEEEELSDYQLMLLNKPGDGYKRMELKGESESDKDLIIYSLNESLQIHKEIVERIQNEKDDLEDKFDQESSIENDKFSKEREEIIAKNEQIEAQQNKLESIYKNLLNELEVKKLEYKRMETRFYSHVKSIRSSEDDSDSIYNGLNQLFHQIHQLSSTIVTKISCKENIIDWWKGDTEIQEVIQQHLLPLDDNTHIMMLTEKIIVDILIQDIFNTSIHPGVSLNDAFGKIHHWVERRNISWASRMKQQISSFVVKQSNEESDQIELKKQDIIHTISTHLSGVYTDVDKIKRKITSIVTLAFKLNIAIKCQENQIDIIHPTFIDENTVTISSGDKILLVVTPHIVALGDHRFNIPAKVYCCA